VNSENTHDFMTERSQVLLVNQCTASSNTIYSTIRYCNTYVPNIEKKMMGHGSAPTDP